MAQGPQMDENARQDHAEEVVKARTGIVLTGKVVNGKVQLDQSAIDEIAKKYPSGQISFIAVNAPFDPKPLPTA